MFDADKVGRRCDFCGSAALVPYEEVKDAFRPESLLPLKVTEPQARDLIRAWYGRQWLAPNAFEREGPHRHRQGAVPAVLDVRRQRRRALARRLGEYYYVREGGQAGPEGAIGPRCPAS